MAIDSEHESIHTAADIEISAICITLLYIVHLEETLLLQNCQLARLNLYTMFHM